ncbi:MAG: hypothetical protein CMH61_02635 [Nanoarchaeota archaeon]|nr:hypothetical protein [Nanoarchaeota archaeon]|tara:strand:- start:759 stop:1142 length:384 start_codon:yes stop_codon:yes gene_type:complete
MAINEWRIWGKKKSQLVDIPKDLDAISEFLSDIENDIKKLKGDVANAQMLFNEAKVVEARLLDKNLTHHIEVMDNVVKDYEIFQSDVNVNGLRVKKIARELIRRAKERGLLDLAREKWKDSRWRGNW